MPDSEREQILTKIKTKLATITTVNGYRNNVGLVSRMVRKPEDLNKEDFPCLFVIGGGGVPGRHEGDSISITRHFSVLILGYIKWNEIDDVQGPGPALETLIDDVRDAIGDDPQFTIPSIVVNTIEGSLDTDEGVLMEAGLPYAGFLFEFIVNYYFEQTNR